MNSLVVGGIIKRVYDKFDMASFSNRLRLQKIVYLLQEAAGINLGYAFSLYSYGPYSAELTKDAFQITDFDKVDKVGFEKPEVENKFKSFLRKLGNRKNDDNWLEIATSIHLIKKLYPSKTKVEIISIIENKRRGLKGKSKGIEKVWDDMEGWLI